MTSPTENRTNETTDELLRQAADLAATRWDPHEFGIVNILATVAPDGSRPDGVHLWDAVVTYLGEELTVPWERRDGRTREQVASMLRAVAGEVSR